MVKFYYYICEKLEYFSLNLWCESRALSSPLIKGSIGPSQPHQLIVTRTQKPGKEYKQGFYKIAYSFKQFSEE